MRPASSPTGQRITRADVARLAGVSSAVVSYVINDGPGPVARATRQRVLNAIDALGYRPDMNARALATGSSQLLGLIVPSISNPLFGEFAVSLESAAAQHGYALLIASSEGDPETERQQIRNLVGRRVDALMMSSVVPYPDISATNHSRTPVILVNTFAPLTGFVTVGTDAVAGAHAATSHLIEHGHRSIGLIIGRNNASDFEAREAGWIQALDDHALPPGPIARAEFSRDGGYEAALRLFGGADHPTAVFASSDLQAIGALAALHKLGLRVPDDVAMISFDGSEETRFSIPALTTVRQPIETIARHLVDEVVGGGASGESHTTFAAELVIRRSCGCDGDQGRPLG